MLTRCFLCQPDNETSSGAWPFEEKQYKILLQWSWICFQWSVSGKIFPFCYWLIYSITSFWPDFVTWFNLNQKRDTYDQRVCAKKSLGDIEGQSDVLNCSSSEGCLAYRQITLNIKDFINGSNGELLLNKTLHPNAKVMICTSCNNSIFKLYCITSYFNSRLQEVLFIL